MLRLAFVVLVVSACASSEPAPTPDPTTAPAPEPAPAPARSPEPAPARAVELPPAVVDLARFSDVRPVLEEPPLRPDVWLSFEQAGRRKSFLTHPGVRKTIAGLRTRTPDAQCAPLVDEALWFFSPTLAYDPARHEMRVRGDSGCWWVFDLDPAVPIAYDAQELSANGPTPQRVRLDKAGFANATVAVESKADVLRARVQHGSASLEMLPHPERLFVETRVRGFDLEVIGLGGRLGDRPVTSLDVAGSDSEGWVEVRCLVEHEPLAAPFCEVWIEGSMPNTSIDEKHRRVAGTITLGGGEPLTIASEVDRIESPTDVGARKVARTTVASTLGTDGPIALWPNMPERAAILDLKGKASVEGKAGGCTFAVDDGLHVTCSGKTTARPDLADMNGQASLRVVEHERFWLVEWSADNEPDEEGEQPAMIREKLLVAKDASGPPLVLESQSEL